MGLDISYFSKLKIDEVEIDFEDYDGDGIYIHPQHFEYQLGSLKIDTLYKLTDESESDGFRAGSYSGYSRWRTELAHMAGYGSAENVWDDFDREIRYVKLKKIENQKVEMKPFYELIYFSDCEGVIGPEICEKLYQDFVNFEDKALIEFENDVSNYNGYFFDLYLKWKEAFRVASDNGLVAFH